MDKKELRIGSLVMSNFKRKNEVVDIKTIDFTEDWFNLFQPIPLTEELALKCGFENTVGNNYVMGNLRVYFNNGGGIFLFYNDNKSHNECIIEVKYFHELQNIAYLFGKIELTLKK